MSVPAHHDPVAVVGMACRLPGAKNLDEFWEMLLEGRDAIRAIPEARFRRDLYYHPDPGVVGKSYSDLAALVDYPQYTADNSVFSARQIAAYDLPHLVLCETAVEAARTARMSPETLRTSRTGVYVGHVLSTKLDAAYSNGVHIPQVAALFHELGEPRSLSRELTERIVDQLVKRVRVNAPNRKRNGNPDLNARRSAELVSEFFGLDGPEIVFNAACASSLQALAHAIKAIELGRCETAIVGGASYFHSDSLILFSAARSLSKNGSCPFTDDADGLVVGEGYVTFILKRLNSAIRDGNPIFATLPGVGVSSDGRGKSLWAPRHEGQIEAIRRAYGGGVDMGAVQYVEAHATSTSLGDRTEVVALCEAFADRFPPDARIPVGSVKRNIGHTLEVAGLAGLLKVILAMQHGIVPPSVHPGKTLNSSIEWDRIPFFVPDQPVAWDPPAGGVSRRAAVEAFGIGGLNVHLVVDQFSTDNIPAIAQPDRSAKVSPATSQAVTGPMAIVGAGLVVPGASTMEAYAQIVREGTCQRKPLPKHRYDASLFTGQGIDRQWAISMPEAGIIDDFQYDWRTHRIPPKQIAQAAPLQFMVLDAVDQALKQYETAAGGSRKRNVPNLDHPAESQFDPKQVGCIVGTEFTGDFLAHLAIGLRLPEIKQVLMEILHENRIPHDQAGQMAEEFGERVLLRFPAILDETGSFTASSLATRVTKTFDFMGGGLAVDSLDPSFAALTCCNDMLYTHACDLMVCVAAQQQVTPETFQILEESGWLASPISPVAPRADSPGMQVPGEGCVVLVLKRLHDARTAGDRILGIIRGLGQARGPNPSEACARAARQAADSGDLAHPDASIVEVVPAGTHSDYTAQLQGILESGGRGSRSTGTPIPAWTFSGQFGLFGAAAGLGAVLKLILALEGNWTAPACWRPDPPPGSQPTAGGKVAFAGRMGVAYHPRERVCGAVNIARPGNRSYHFIIERDEPMSPEKPTQLISEKTEEPRSIINGIVHFDATTVRRARMRTTAAGRYATNSAPGATSTPIANSSQEPKGEAELVKPSPLENPDTISLAPLVSVALSPSQRGPTVPAAKAESSPGTSGNP